MWPHTYNNNKKQKQKHTYNNNKKQNIYYRVAAPPGYCPYFCENGMGRVGVGRVRCSQAAECGPPARPRLPR